MLILSCQSWKWFLSVDLCIKLEKAWKNLYSRLTSIYCIYIPLLLRCYLVTMGNSNLVVKCNLTGAGDHYLSSLWDNVVSSLETVESLAQWSRSSISCCKDGRWMGTSGQEEGDTRIDQLRGTQTDKPMFSVPENTHCMASRTHRAPLTETQKQKVAELQLRF